MLLTNKKKTIIIHLNSSICIFVQPVELMASGVSRQYVEIVRETLLKRSVDVRRTIHSRGGGPGLRGLPPTRTINVRRVNVRAARSLALQFGRLVSQLLLLLPLLRAIAICTCSFWWSRTAKCRVRVWSLVRGKGGRLTWDELVEPFSSAGRARWCRSIFRRRNLARSLECRISKPNTLQGRSLLN